MVEALRGTTRTDPTQSDGQGISVGVQGTDGKLRQETVTPDQPLEVNGVRVSVDDRGQVTVHGTD